jgi:hypothetical protein
MAGPLLNNDDDMLVCTNTPTMDCSELHIPLPGGRARASRTTVKGGGGMRRVPRHGAMAP